MPSGAAVRRYAQAVFEMADEQGTLDRWEADLGRLAQAFAEPTVAAYFDSPQVPAHDKVTAANELLGPEAQPLARNLVALLIERGRIRILPRIYQDFHDRRLERQGIAVGEVTTAVPLSQEELALVRQRLGVLVGKDVELRSHVDPAIIGGIVARVGDQLIDGSVIGQLQKLRERLVTAER